MMIHTTMAGARWQNDLTARSLKTMSSQAALVRVVNLRASGTKMRSANPSASHAKSPAKAISSKSATT